MLVAGNLGVNPVTGDHVPSASTMQLTKAADTTERKGPISRIVNSLKATPGGSASSEAASTSGSSIALAATGGLSNLFKKKDRQEG